MCPHLALLLSGIARVYKLGENGRDITLYRVRPGQSCVLTASCILSRSRFPAFAQCEKTADAILLPSTKVNDWAARSQPFRDYIFGLVAERLGDLISVVEEVVFHRMDQRLAAYLAERKPDAGATIRTTHQEIASDLGTSREVVSRILKDFEGRGLIRIGRGALELANVSALRAKGGDV
jgi:CRP/FNR family transcriptional regulator